MSKSNEITDICIPRMEANITRKFIFSIFQRLNIGKVERIIENKLKTNENYKRIILKIRWNNTEKAVEIRQRLNNNLPVNIVYELPWFWKVVLAK